MILGLPLIGTKSSRRSRYRQDDKPTAETSAAPTKPTISGPFWTGKKSAPDLPKPPAVVDARQRTIDFAGAHAHFQKSLELQARHGDIANQFGQLRRAAAEIWDALALWVLGRINEALRLPAAPSPIPSRQRMLQRWVKLSATRRCWGLFAATPKQSQTTAKRWPTSCLATISQPFGSAG